MGSQTTLSESEIYYWLALHLTPGVGAVRFARLLEYFKTPYAVFKASAEELAQVPRLSPKITAALVRFDWADDVVRELKRIQKLGINLITINDPFYPSRLKEIYNPPPLIWVDGEISEADNVSVAIVGSRGATEYGREISYRLAGDLAAAGVSVVRLWTRADGLWLSWVAELTCFILNQMVIFTGEYQNKARLSVNFVWEPGRNQGFFRFATGSFPVFPWGWWLLKRELEAVH
ncbi:MAG: DNA-protecting protein DprA [Deltaproteobacteria bacterium]|nr:DNA-protecting protein DprA [Deltaproteobacteria bacterium]